MQDKPKLILAHNGKTPYVIFVPEEAIPSETYAAEELKNFLEQITGISFPIVHNLGGCDTEHVLFVGPVPRARMFEELPDTSGMAEDELYIKTLGGRIILTGGRPRGALYAVYTFLEDFLGCRWYTPAFSVIPSRSELSVAPIDYHYTPHFTYRNDFAFAGKDSIWATRNKLTPFMGVNSEKLAGSSAGFPAGHSFFHHVPPAVYAAEHSEYYSEIDGVRVTGGAPFQICLTNPEVLRITIESVKKQLRSNTDPSFHPSVAQEDWQGYCTCDKCRAVDEAEGSHSGTLIHFVNAVADGIKDEFPGRMIKTFAYQYTQVAPRHVKPRDNVMVCLCSIESCYAHPFGTCNMVRRELPSPDGRKTNFARDVKDWAAITKNMVVWDYVTNFRNFMLPHPNLQSLGPNLRYLRDCGIKGIFCQGCSTSRNTEMTDLRTYMIAKLMWNPDADDKMIMNDFLGAMYHSASAPIRAYIKLLQDQFAEEKCHLFMSQMPVAPHGEGYEDGVRSSMCNARFPFSKDMPTTGLAWYMTEDVIKESNRLFDLAEALADNDETLERVRIARLPLRFTEITTMPLANPARLGLLNAFFEDLHRYGVTEIKEAKTLSQSYEAIVLAQYLRPGF